MTLAQNWRWTAISSCDITPLRFSRTEKGERSSWVSDSALGSLARPVNRQIRSTQRPHVSVRWTPRRNLSNDWTICESCFKRTNGIDMTRPKKKTWRLMGTNCHHKNALAMPLPPPHILAWRKGCDHDAASWLLLQGLMRRFGGLRAAFSLSVFFLYTAFVTSSAICPPPPPSHLNIGDLIKSMQWSESSFLHLCLEQTCQTEKEANN